MGTMQWEANPASRTTALGFRLLDGIQAMIIPTSTAVAVGDCLAVDETVTANGLYTTMKVVAAGDLTGMGLFGIALDAVASNSTSTQTVRIQFFGYISQAAIAAAYSGGAELAATAAARTLTTIATGQKVIAKLITTTSGAALSDVFFDGINGFGCLA